MRRQSLLPLMPCRWLRRARHTTVTSVTAVTAATTTMTMRHWRRDDVLTSATHGARRRVHTHASTTSLSSSATATTMLTSMPPQRRVQRWHVAATTIAQQPQQPHDTVDTTAARDDNKDEAASLPPALRRAQAAMNVRRKTWLMAALGSNFVRAGLSHHGTQTSFSAVQSHALQQQLTGLPHIPAKLLLSCLVADDDDKDNSMSGRGRTAEAACAPASYEWVDVSAHPTATLTEFRAALREVLPRLGVPVAAVEGNAEPMQLPQATMLTPTSLHGGDGADDHSSNNNSEKSDGGGVSSATPSVSARRRGAASATACQLILRYAIDTTASGVHGGGGRHRMRATTSLPPSHHAAVASASASSATASFQDLTNRFTLYLLPGRVVTVHRSECVFVEELKLRWRGVCAREHVGDGRYIAQYFVRATLATFSRALTHCIAEFDAYEAGLFAARLDRAALARAIYHIKRRATVYGRTLTMTQDAFARTATALQMHPASVRYQEIQHDLAHIHALADGLNANADSVLQILFQLSSYQVNELMRVLTLFSAFFIPLSFIAAVYGMNFEQLPFLNMPHGELYCGVLMCVVALVIYVWFKGNRFI